MKKTMVVLTAFMLSCSLVYSQEADGLGPGAELTVVPRLDLNPQIPFGSGGSNDLTLGDSSFYTLFDGTLTPWLSFSVCNHWLSTSPGDLYRETFFRSDTVNWNDWMYLAFTPGNWTFTLGKDTMTIGGWEFDDNDYLLHNVLCSGMWQNLSCYQWGLKAGWTTPDEGSTFSFQWSTSPYGRRPFADGLFNYSLQWLGEYGPLSTNWAVTAVGNGEDTCVVPRRYTWLVGLGERLDAGDFSFIFDWYSRVGDPEQVLRRGNTFLLTAQYAPSESLEFLLKGGIETGPDTATRFGGAAVHWYPLRGSRDLRVHGVAGVNPRLWDNALSLTVGLLYTLHLSTR